MRLAHAPALAAVLLLACDDTSSLNQLYADLVVTPSPISMPETARGVEKTAPVTLRNSGNATLEVTSITVDGTEEWDLTLPVLPLQLQPNGTADVALTYLPIGDPQPAFLVIRSNDPAEPTVRIPIEATLRTGPSLILCAAAAGVPERCTDGATSFDLGTITVGHSVTATITVKTTGEGLVQVESLALGASASPELMLPPITTSFTLAPGDTVTRFLRFAPTTAGTFGGDVHARAADRSLASPRLTITAAAATAPLPAALCVSPTSVDFGTVALGDRATRTVELTACGGSAVDLMGATVPAGAFALASGLATPLRLEPGTAAMQVNLQFAPTAAGRATGELRIETSAGPATVTLSGGTPSDGTLSCLSGMTGTSWRDLLPQRPAANPPAPMLGMGTGVAATTCAGEATVVTDPNMTETHQSRLAYGSGRWYFEATVEQFTAGWSSVGIAAAPADAFQLSALFMSGISAGGVTPSATGVISVLADLDAGVAYFYANGALTDTARLLIIPGVGAFHGTGVSMIGNKLRFNYGADAFTYAVPAGWSPWSGGAAGANGACVGDVDQPAPPATIEAYCDGGARCAGSTTFASGADGSPELIVLGVYDSGSTSSWTWGTDAAGNPIEVTVGPGHNGSILVEVERPGPIALVLSAYEPTDWTVRVGGGATLASVSAYGMHLQTIAGVPAGVPTDIHTICTGGDGGNCPGFTGDRFPIAPHSWPYDTGGGDTQGFIDAMEERFCLPLEAFAGSYVARRFVVR